MSLPQAKGPMELIYAGKPAGMAKPRPDGLWDCIDRRGAVLGLPFPNRARAIEALVIIARRVDYGGAISLRHVKTEKVSALRSGPKA